VDHADALLVHGTLFGFVGSGMEEWWKPGSGDLHEFLRKGPRPGVYSGSDYYRWSGGWNDFARDEAVRTLTDWVRGHSLSALDVFAHSHGANVAMLATHRVPVRNLVLMSCPVHWEIYKPDFANVAKVVSIRAKWDLVIMADRGDQRFPDHPQIAEHVLPIWFARHDSSRRSSTWRREQLAAYLDATTASPSTTAPAVPPLPSPEPASPPPVRAFEQFVAVKGPVETAEAFIDALRRLPEVYQAEFRPVVFKKSPPRDKYTILVKGDAALYFDRIRDVAREVGAEVLFFDRPPW
jgi:hypothetical protein